MRNRSLFPILVLLAAALVLGGCEKYRQRIEEMRQQVSGNWDVVFYSRAVFGSSGVLLGEDVVIDTGQITFYETGFGETDIFLFRDDAGFLVDFFYWKPRTSSVEIGFRDNFGGPSIDFNDMLIRSNTRMVWQASSFNEVDMVTVDYRLEMIK